MSEIKLKKILKFSSEDNTYKADNLLDHSNKWLSSQDEETKQFVLIQLDEPSEIRQVNIENESSAFIEILVGNQTDSEEDFKDLLTATSFMSPSESKSITNKNRLKIFTNETTLVKDVSNQKWEILKIVCNQPFNPKIQFGISNIKLYNQIINEDVKDAAKINTGIFSLKKELTNSSGTIEKMSVEIKKDEEKDEIKIGSVYQKWKNNQTNIKEETNESNSTNSKRKIEEIEENNDLKKVTSSSNSKKSDHSNSPNTKKTSSNQILKGVVFALSGFQNPLRSEIRDKGLKLGAKYRPDWTDDCTHLVCAFKNTPKADQVRKSGGLIVNKEWIFDCEKEKKLLDCDDYKLEESDSEDDDRPRKAAKNAQKKLTKLNTKDEFDDSYDEEEAENSDDRDFIVGSSEEEEDDFKISESEKEEEEEESFDSDDSEGAKRSKKSNKNIKKNNQKKKHKKTKKGKKSSSSSSSSNNKSSSESEIDLEEYKKKKEKEMHKKYQKENKKKEINYESSEDELEKKSKNKSKKIKLDNESVTEKKPLKKTQSSSSDKTEVNSDLDEHKDEKENKDWELPCFFDKKQFYIYGDFDPNIRKKLSRIVIAYGGNVNDYMSGDVEFVISDKNWNDEFEQSLKDNPNIKFITPEWLETCNKRRKLLSYNFFEIKPEED